ncbi:hypothetical protein ALC60_02180 [Trachymyrmex zeteki]|uniref:Uncharacterized protein n=1 Tax=Mycetomoellerius zeteki TaxID=64791 RepID=A0A151XDU6_9HYME|nr:hypothetical protein ALC60_02180 [Trachymyrmex zeteki]
MQQERTSRKRNEIISTGPQERKRKREKEETRDNWEAQVIYLVVSSMILYPPHGFRYKRNGAKGTTTDALYRAKEEERVGVRSARDIQAKRENEEREKQGGKTKRASERRRERHDDARCWKATGKSGTDEEANEEEVKEEKEKKKERVPRRQEDGGERKRGGSDGVNCRRQGHRLYLAGTADTCLRRYTRTVL